MNVIEQPDENPSLKVVGGDRPSTTDPSSLDRNGFRLDVPELNSDEDEQKLKDFEASGGEAALMTEAFYNVGGISSTAPEWLKSAIESRANYLQKTADSFTKGNGGPVGKKTKQEEAEENNEKAAEWFENHMEKVSQSLKEVDQNGILKDWDKRSFDFGDVSIDAEGWDNFMSIMKDPKARRAAIDKIAAEKGWTKDEKQKAEADMMEAYRIMERVKHGEATQADLDRLNQIGLDNPKALEGIKEIAAPQAAEALLKIKSGEATAEDLRKLDELKKYNPTVAKTAEELASTTENFRNGDLTASLKSDVNSLKTFREGDIQTPSINLTESYNISANGTEILNKNPPAIVAANQITKTNPAPMLTAEI
ncbi:MAG: hypothetical protein DI586_05845 [Micavibrio aeruginosavorus]|uniref:Uncharacterized protein n=1 Tax=Micavibrio aeruginosavorus TaxID=349221 RepID=A0A2W5FPM5_9BACT|nr:MAG: hypothetical protein DI586_05845 [Micavibrio aeruginosavorus]